MPAAPRHALALLLALAAAAVGLAACANPLPPTGGPRDETPPTVVRTVPAADAVNVTRTTVEIAFSEYIDKASVRQALSLTPEPPEPLELDVDARGVTVFLPTPLRDSTTYIVTLGTTLKDARGVALAEPLTFAFATGPTLNRGELAGRVLEQATGRPAPGLAVYAYRADSIYAAPTATARRDTTARRNTTADTAAAGLPRLPARPAYRIQTGADGAFRFRYLREQAYVVVAVDDANGNRTLDPGEAFALPPVRTLRADSAGSADSAGKARSSAPAAPWLLARPDRSGPTLARADAPTSRRARLRFSEPVRLARRAPAAWAADDTTTGATVPAEAVFLRYAEPDARLARAVDVRFARPLAPRPHRLALAAGLVTDTLGQPLRPVTARFTPPEGVPDTARARFAAFLPSRAPDTTAGGVEAVVLLPPEAPTVRLTRPAAADTLAAALAVTDTTGAAPRAVRLATDDGVTFRLALTPPLRPGDVIDVQVDRARLGGPTDSVATRRYRRIPNRALGSLTGTVALAAAVPDSVQADSVQADRAATDRMAGDLVVELVPDDPASPVGVRQAAATPDGTFTFDGLPEAAYRFRAFFDRNANRRWDAGRLRPFTPPEPVAWRTTPAESRPRWETVLDDTLRVERY